MGLFRGQVSDTAACRRIRLRGRVRWVLVPAAVGFLAAAVAVPLNLGNGDFAHDLATQDAYYAQVTSVGSHWYGGSYLDVTVDGKVLAVDYPDDEPGVKAGQWIEVVDEPDDPTSVLAADHPTGESTGWSFAMTAFFGVAGILCGGGYLGIPRRGRRQLRRTHALLPAVVTGVVQAGGVRRSWRAAGDLFYARLAVTVEVEGRALELGVARFRSWSASQAWQPEVGDEIRVSAPAEPGGWVLACNRRGESLAPIGPASEVVAALGAV